MVSGGMWEGWAPGRLGLLLWRGPRCPRMRTAA